MKNYRISTHNHLLNHSHAKQMYTFGHGERFPKISRNGYSDTIYNLPSQKIKRYAGMGYGSRSDFTAAHKHDNPNFYAVKREFDLDNLHGPFFSITGKSTYVQNDKYKLGPGTYNFTKPFGWGAPSFSLKGRDGPSVFKIKKEGPGPGAYRSFTMSNNGKYANSKIKNIHVYDFGHGKGHVGLNSKSFTPGPNYNLPSLTGGNYFNSKYKNIRNITFGGRTTFVDSRRDYPGPGSYTPFSEFGFLTEQNWMRKKKKNKLNKKKKKGDDKKEDDKKKDEKNNKKKDENKKNDDDNDFYVEKEEKEENIQQKDDDFGGNNNEKNNEDANDRIEDKNENNNQNDDDER